MEVKEIKLLVTLMHEYGLTELEVQDKRGKIRLVRSGGTGESGADSAVQQTAVPARARTAAKIAGRAAAGEAPAIAPGKPPALEPNQTLVESPMVGTFFRSPSPETPPFVEDGAAVHKGQTLCIIEAMKMMNEIAAPVTGRIIRVLCANAQPVEYGQALMVLEVD